MGMGRTTSNERIRVGVSACLLGQNVRYAGDNREDAWVTGTLARYFALVPVCPEVEVGMGVPRETVRLEGAVESPRMVGTGSRTDWSEPMRAFAAERVGRLAGAALRGYVFKKGSPSCGLYLVPVFDRAGLPHRAGRGLFAAELTRRLPLLPVADEKQLQWSAARGSFVVRVFALDRVQPLLNGTPAAGTLAAFHAEHEPLLAAHGPRYRDALDRLVARAAEHEPGELARAYASLFVRALAASELARRDYEAVPGLMGYTLP